MENEVRWDGRCTCKTERLEESHKADRGGEVSHGSFNPA